MGLISQTDNSGNQSYFLGNGLDSTEALVDGSGIPGDNARWKVDQSMLRRPPACLR